jgi:hypothetical protein
MGLCKPFYSGVDSSSSQSSSSSIHHLAAAAVGAGDDGFHLDLERARLGIEQRATTTMVEAGRMAPKNSP